MGLIQFITTLNADSVPDVPEPTGDNGLWNDTAYFEGDDGLWHDEGYFDDDDGLWHDDIYF